MHGSQIGQYIRLLIRYSLRGNVKVATYGCPLGCFVTSSRAVSSSRKPFEIHSEPGYSGLLLPTLFFDLFLKEFVRLPSPLLGWEGGELELLRLFADFIGIIVC